MRKFQSYHGRQSWLRLATLVLALSLSFAFALLALALALALVELAASLAPLESPCHLGVRIENSNFRLL